MSGRVVEILEEEGVKVLEKTLQESKTEANAVAGVVTFAANITHLEIINRDGTNDGVFTVNDIPIPLVKSTKDANGNYSFLSFWKDGVGGTLGKTVTITGSTSYILNRFE